MPALTIALSVLTELPSLIQAGINVLGLIESAAGVIKQSQAEGRDPTPDEWATLDAQISDLRKQLNS